MAFSVRRLDPANLNTNRTVRVKCYGQVFEGVLRGTVMQIASVQGDRFVDGGDYQWYIFDNFKLLDRLTEKVYQRYKVGIITIGDYQIERGPAAWRIKWRYFRRQLYCRMTAVANYL